MSPRNPEVEMIPIEQIHILNPRTRNPQVFQSIVTNISNIGLKRPITVSRRSEPFEGKFFDLVCGQGRLEAYKALGQREIPAIVKDVTREDCYLMSLVENIARRKHPPVELVREVSSLRARGYSAVEIAQKIDMAKSYVTAICHLVERGEERLLDAVEAGKLPVSVAMQIASSDEDGIQTALCEAYEDQSLRGRKLRIIRRLIEQRKLNGKSLASEGRSRTGRLPTAQLLVKAYRQEADRQKLLVRKARLTEHRLLLIVSALKRLFADENFLNLLRAEGLDSIPAFLADQVRQHCKE